MNPELFVFVDIVKGALLRRMARELMTVWGDNFLPFQHRMKAAALYERVGDNFVAYIKSLHRVKSPKLLYLLAGGAVKVFQDNLDVCWAMSYSPNFKTRLKVQWLEEVTANEFE